MRLNEVADGAEGKLREVAAHMLHQGRENEPGLRLRGQACHGDEQGHLRPSRALEAASEECDTRALEFILRLTTTFCWLLLPTLSPSSASCACVDQVQEGLDRCARGGQLKALGARGISLKQRRKDG